MSGGAPKEVFALLAPRFEQQTDNKVEFTYAVITELREKLSAGATADVLVLPTAVLDSLAKDGKVRAGNRPTFGTVGIRVVVKEGAQRPAFQTRKNFVTRCLLPAPSFMLRQEKRRVALTWAR